MEILSKVVALIAAAGKSRRFGSPKALAFIDPLLKAYSSSIADSIIVTWPRDLLHPTRPNTTFIHNQWDELGLSGSILAARDTCPELSALIINPIDAPFTSSKLVDNLIQHHRSCPGALFIVPRCETKQKNGHPILVNSNILHRLREVATCGGLKALMAQHPDSIHTLPAGESCLANLNVDPRLSEGARSPKPFTQYWHSSGN